MNWDGEKKATEEDVGLDTGKNRGLSKKKIYEKGVGEKGNGSDVRRSQ